MAKEWKERILMLLSEKWTAYPKLLESARDIRGKDEDKAFIAPTHVALEQLLGEGLIEEKRDFVRVIRLTPQGVKERSLLLQ